MTGTDDPEPIPFLDILAPVMQRCALLAERLAHLLLPD
jgi:hypothetical protein